MSVVCLDHPVLVSVVCLDQPVLVSVVCLDHPVLVSVVCLDHPVHGDGVGSGSVQHRHLSTVESLQHLRD